MLYVDDINKVGFYIMHLKTLIDSMNKFTQQAKTVNPMYEGEKFNEMCYEWQEYILMKIYDFLPYKLVIDPTLSGYEFIPEDNLFHSTFNMESLTNKLSMIRDSHNEDFLFFNYYMRNSYYHKKHLVDYIGTLATPTISLMKMKISVINENQSRKQFNYLKKQLGTKDSCSLTNNIILIKDSSSPNIINLNFQIEVDDVKNIIGKIADAFINILEQLINDVISMNNSDIIKDPSVTKASILNALFYWKRQIPFIL